MALIQKIDRSFCFFLNFLKYIIYGVDFHLIFFFYVFHDIGFDMNTMNFFLDAIFIDSKGSQLLKVHTKQRIAQIRKTFHNFLKVHFEQLGLQIS